MPYMLVFGQRVNVIRSPSEKMPAKSPVWMAPRMRRLMTVSVFLNPVRDRVRMTPRVPMQHQACIRGCEGKAPTGDEDVDRDLQDEPSCHELGQADELGRAVAWRKLVEQVSHRVRRTYTLIIQALIPHAMPIAHAVRDRTIIAAYKTRLLVKR